MINLPFLADGPAACAQPGYDPELWQSTADADRAAAAGVCAGCVVRPGCLDYALSADERRGTWGGLTATERRRLRSDDGSWLDGQGRLRRPCGDEGALVAHRRYAEVCVVCEAAHEEHVLARRRAALAVAHEAGGTTTGAELHRRIGEAVCGLCRGAVARQSAARRAARQTGTQPAARAA